MIPPILITGIPRSGTSMTAGIVNLCRAWGGNLAGPNRHNAKGMFENRAIVNTVLKPFLVSIGADPMGQKPLPDMEIVAAAAPIIGPKWRRRIEDIFTEQGYPGGTWWYKGVKMCLVWPVWATAFPGTKYMIVRRDREEIARSCLRTSFMRAYSGMEGWLGWIAEHERRFEEMREADLDIREVWSRRIVEGDLSEIRSVIDWLSLDFNEDAIREFVDPKLYSKGE